MMLTAIISAIIEVVDTDTIEETDRLSVCFGLRYRRSTGTVSVYVYEYISVYTLWFL